MRRLSIIAVTFLALLVVTNAAQAVGLTGLPTVFSPNSDASPYTAPTTDDVFISQFNSVWLAKPFNSDDNFVYPESPNNIQAAGIYGVGASLASLPALGGYNVTFDYHLRTYDSSAYDTFRIAITEGGYLWNSGVSLVDQWLWGGASIGGLESFDTTPVITTFLGAGNLAVNDYLNVVLVTDGLDTSWGRFSDISIVSAAVPEPATLLLLGAGLIGLAGYSRKKFKSN
jgi:hypothetical protein